ncbi:MAG: sigma-54 dependent transcriptional regulator [Candidatus Korobacteraceae bacterium]
MQGKSHCAHTVAPPDDIIFGGSPAMCELRPLVEQIAKAEVPVLIYGSTGTGKEVIAGFIHRHSLRSQAPHVKISCGAIPTPLIESELFGYEEGAFTGAYRKRRGMVESAHTGSLVLDNISDLDIGVQAKLLQLLQNGTFMRIGGEEELKIDVRAICITTRDPRDEVAEGKLLQDLYYRINTTSLRIPNLRERADDISGISDYLIKTFNELFGTKAAPLSAAVYRVFRRYHWPGNIRELENVIRRYVVLGKADTIAEEIARRALTFPPAQVRETADLSFKSRTEQLVREAEAQVILRVLHRNNWNRRKTAEMLNISYRALLYKIRNAGLRGYASSKGTARSDRDALLNYTTSPEA